MRAAVFSVVAFTVTMVGSTVIKVQRAPYPVVPVDTVALADSLLADSLWRDSVIYVASPPNREPEAYSMSSVMPTSRSVVPAQESQPGDSALSGASAEESAEALQALAQIFARMKPEDAAQILSHMSDREVEGVVRNLAARQAASVLSNLPEARAANLARRLMDARGERQ